MEMVIAKFLLQSFENKEFQEQIIVEVPWGSTLRAAIVMHEGIYLWYEVPKDESKTRQDRFVIVNNKVGVPENARYIDILHSVVEMGEGKQGIIVYPIYQLK